VAEWRFHRRWTESELKERLASLEHVRRNWGDQISEDGLTPARGFHYHHSTAIVAREPPGLPVPGGPYERAVRLISDYEFSDPRIVTAHFDKARPLDGRRMLLELAVLGLRYLVGTVVGAVHRDEDSFGFRYDTLVGHIETGAEWFFLMKDRQTGEIRFQIEAAWREGDFPNVWSRVGFAVLGRRYQRAWHRLAHLRLRTLLRATDLPPLPAADDIVQEGRGIPLPRMPRAARLEEERDIR
jgi:uncharacterized protein (UPF0548 family)